MKVIFNNIPFFSNTKDNTHCYQAALKIVLKHFMPYKTFSMKALDELTAHSKSLWTWPTQAIINLHKMGFEIVDIDDFDISKFIKLGDKYLIQKYGSFVAKEQKTHSNISRERKIYREYLSLGLHQQRIPKVEEINDLLQKGYLVICNLNAQTLNRKAGYIGHFVVIFGIDDKYVYIHDPGLPPIKNRKITHKDFIQAWAYPDAQANNILAFRLN